MSKTSLKAAWQDALTEAERKITQRNLMQQIQKRLRKATESDVIELNKKTQEVHKGLQKILSDAVGLKVDVWELIAPTVVYPSEPDYGQPELHTYPQKQTLKREDAPSFDKAPMKRIVTIEDMKSESVLENVQDPPKQNWLKRQFKEHPYICWGIFIFVILQIIGGQ